MKIPTDKPVFVLTGDVDWAAEACIEDFAGEFGALGIKPVLMATGPSAALKRLHADGAIELGVHPNFLPGSSHGGNVPDVIEHICGLYPEATTFRSHSFVDSSQITALMKGRGFKYDSNLCLHLQEGLFPLQHESGLVRFPVFWEEDVHWDRGGQWDADELISTFMTPGLKILNVHPLNFALNVPDAQGYQRIKSKTQSLTAQDLKELRFQGPGTRTFLLSLVKKIIAAGFRFHTLKELHDLHAESAHANLGADTGRTTLIKREEYEAYQQRSATEKQDMLKDAYEKRNSLDRYATSRDFNLRELEIAALGRYLPEGEVVDLGCGNGYTLISLAKNSGGSSMVGVDFSENLITGAVKLAEMEGVAKPPKFVCADAIKYVCDLAPASVDAVITERFLLNLPDVQVQQKVIAESFRVLRPGGRLLMCEGSMQGFRGLNSLRKALGLAEILETSADNMSARRFEDAEIEEFSTKQVGFHLIAKVGFSDYFAISRAIHPLLIAPEKPRFDAKINELARQMQLNRPLNPEIGSNVIWVLEKR